MGRSLASRVKVVGPAVAVGMGLAALATCSGAIKMGWQPGDAAEVWASVLAGPFAGLWATSTWRWVDVSVWSAVCLFAAAHPLRAGTTTGRVSATGVGLWFFLGLALTFDGV